MLRCFLRAAAGASAGRAGSRNPFVHPSTPILVPISFVGLSHYSSKASSSKGKKKGKATTGGSGKSHSNAKIKSKKDPKTNFDEPSLSAPSLDDGEFELPTDPLPVAYDPALDVGPGGRPLFCLGKSISQITRRDACSYLDFSLEELREKLPEGLPLGMRKEFEETRRCAVMVRQSFLDLRDNFRRIVDPPLRAGSKSPRVQKQIVLDGLVSCGKSIALAMLVHWARSEGWLVFYVPHGREWTHGGFFYRNPHTNLWDTPVQAAKILEDFLKFNESQLQKLPVQIFDPVPLGEGAGVGMMKGVDSMAMPEGSTLFDLIKTGLTYPQAAVGVAVRLRKELSLVKDIPVLFAIDQYNSWFTFSEYEEAVTVRSTQPIHAKELSTVNAYRSMLHNDMMVGAFSHSTAVGKLRKELPDVPVDARILFPRYNLDEAATVCHYYLRQRLIRREAFSDEKWKKIFFLSNGNGSEMRWLVPFI